VDVEPALFDWRGMRTPVLLPTGAAMAREERRAVMRMVERILAVCCLLVGWEASEELLVSYGEMERQNDE